MLRAKYLGKAITIFCCKDGTISFAPRGKRSFNGAALPVYSVDTKKEAISLQVLTCRRQYGPHPDYPKKLPDWYRLGSGPFPMGFSGELEDLPKVSEHLAASHALIQARSTASV